MNGFRLSPQQRRLWRLRQLRGDGVLAARLLAVREGDLDAGELRRAAERAVRRHEVLRTTFSCPAGVSVPLQHVGDAGPDWEEVDLSGLPEPEQRARLAEPASPPDLEAGPVVRFLLARLAPERHALRIDLPALCSDAVSLENLLAEIAGEMPEGDVFQYADLAEWQAGFLEGEETESGRDVWRQRGLADLPPLRLPFVRREPAPFLPARLPVPLDPPLPPGVLLAGWQCLLRRFTGQAEVTLGAGRTGRGYDGLAEAIGPLARYVPLTARIEAGEPFRAVAGRAAKALAEAGEWQEFFDWEALLGPPGEAGPPVLAAGFDVHERRAVAPGFAIESIEVSPEPFAVCLTGDGYRLELLYDRGAVSGEDARALARSLAALLAAAAADPDLHVEALPLLDEAERARIIAAAGGFAPEQAPGCLHRRIEEQARLHPGRPAVVFEDREMTYGELDERASRLAARLRRQGAGPDKVVALRLERGIEMIAAILGVWKAGAAYLPVDPSLPAERQEMLVRDSGAVTVLSGLDGADPDADAAGPEPAPENLAYVLYTSGSTGRPKGVMVEHRQLWSYVHAVSEVLDLPPGSSYATVSTFAADLGNTAVFPALATGGTLHVLSQERIADARAMADYFERHAVDCLKIVPSHLEALQASARGDRLLPRRRLVVGGEACRWEWVDAVRAAAPGCRVINHYGPTETTVGVATCDLGEAWEHRPRTSRPPLGRPLAGCRLHLLDARLEPVPDWMPGEICAGGAQVARGYLGRPEATAERFLPDPFGPPGGRLYRTGDLARRLPDGNLEFLGRADDQVKVRGFRVEPGEVAAVLAAHPGVRRAEVLARADGAGHPRLVAYTVGTVPAAELRAFLAGRLPDFMVPAAFVPLEALPLTANGKVDRRRLPEPDWNRLGPKTYEAPRDALEETLAEVWGAVLGKDHPGIDDDFFALGGDSILSIVVSARAEERGLAFPVQQLFETPTIRGLAAALRSRTSSPASRPGVGPFELIAPEDRAGLPAGVEDAYPLAQLQAGMLFHSQLNPESAVYHDLHSFHLRAPFDPGAMAGALRRAVARHPALRTAFDLTREGEPLQLVFRELEPSLAVEDLRGLPEAERRRCIDEWLDAERGRPFDAAVPPLVRFAIHRRTDETFQFTISFHHAVLDGWSRASLLTELFRLYLALAAGADPGAPPLAVGYRDFVALERETLRSGEARDYWRRSLADATATPLPRWPSPSTPQPQGINSHLVTFPPEVSDGLHAVAREAGAPVKSVLLAGHLAVVSRLAGRDDVISGVVSHGRPEQADGERVLGLFLNNLPFHARLAGGSWRELVRRVFAQEREMLPHRRLPLAGLQRETGPLFEAVFNFLHYHVYQGLAGLSGVEVLEQWNYEETNFPLLAHFYLVPATGRVELLLNLRRPDLGAAQGEAIAGLYRRALAALAADPEGRHDAAVLLSAAERHQVLLEWNDTRAPFPGTTLLHQFFEAAVERTPQAVAAVCDGHELTYAGLEARSNRLARLLRDVGVGRGTPVGVWVERSLDMLTAILGVLKAGGHYVALDDAWPAGRVESILAATATPAIVAGAGLLGAVEEMRWRLPALSDIVCLAVAEPEPPAEPLDPEGVRELWDLVAERAVDRVTAGGFVSAFTGEPMSEAEVDEYRDRVLSLAAPWLRPDAPVLEIGNGSGLFLWEMAGRVARITGVDPSPLTQERNRGQAAREGYTNVELLTGFAHEIDGLIGEDERFDLILLASTVQFFPGPRYLERVVRWALGRLAPGGALLIADVLDARRREELRRAIEERRPGTAAFGGGRRQELYLDEDLFADLGAAAVHHRTEGFPNELRFRYDVLLTPGGEVERRKRLWTGWHVDRMPAGRLAAVAKPDDVAYVIHTSGSTGEPKGIVVQHRPAANLLDWINRTFEIGPADRGLFVTSLCFDLSVYDIFGLLAAGGTVHVATPEDLRDPDRLMGLLRTGGITLWDSAPAALVQLAPLFPAEPDRSSRLRRVLLSGDWIPVTLPDRVRQSFPGARVMALGGATEATVWSNWFPVGAVDPSWPSIPYGRPIANARYHVLDTGFAPCPIGTPGDLYIGGDCLCAGYARRPDLTALAFLPDPFAGSPGSRLYRTGDRARYKVDGNLEFLGRLDQQVKVRGYRIELGEIEVALARHPGVREAVVLAREDEPGDKRLVAYVVPAAEPAPAPADLRDALRQALPEYMVPAAFVPLTELPVTPNGKLDRRALPAPEWSGDAGYEAPRTPMEEILAAIWSAVLGISRVGREDHFFELGGHSLLAMQVASRVRQAFGVELPLRTLFEAPTLAAFAARVAVARSEGGRAEAPPILPVPRDFEPPLSFAQQRLWFLQQLDPESPAYNVPAAVRLTGPLDPAALGGALEEVVHRHEALRTHFETRPGGPVQVIDAALPLPLPWIDLSALAEETREAEARRLAITEARRPFDLGRKPLLRTTLLRLGGADHALLLTLHHAVSDGWSMTVLLRETIVLYRAFAAGAPSPLPPLPVQYADFAVWQRGWLRGEVLGGQLDYWRGRLAGAPAVLRLPTDRPRPSGPPGAGASRTLELPEGLTNSLRALARREGATLFMVLFAAWAAVLRHFTGQEDLVLGTDIANRNRAETEGLIGFFVNLLPLRIDLAGDPDVRGLVARVREATLGAYAHQDVPFEALVQELGIEREPGLPPLVQAVIDFQTASPGLPELPGVALAELAEVGGAEAKFDLVLIATDPGDSGRGLSCALRYRTDLFYASTAAGLLEGLELCLDLMARRSEAQLGTLLDALTESARRRDQEARDAVERRRLGRPWRTRPQSMAVQEMEGGT